MTAVSHIAQAAVQTQQLGSSPCEEPGGLPEEARLRPKLGGKPLARQGEMGWPPQKDPVYAKARRQDKAGTFSKKLEFPWPRVPSQLPDPPGPLPSMKT